MRELPPTLTVLDVAAYLGVSKPTVDRRISCGELKSYKNGRLRRIRREDLLEYESRLLKAVGADYLKGGEQGT
jgi:excisionase family DNA binding protein